MDNIDKKVFDYIPREDAMPWPESESMGAMAPAPLPRRELERTEQEKSFKRRPKWDGGPYLFPAGKLRDFEKKFFTGILSTYDKFFEMLDEGELDLRPGSLKLWDLLYRHAMDPKTQKESMLGKQTPHRITPTTRY